VSGNPKNGFKFFGIPQVLNFSDYFPWITFLGLLSLDYFPWITFLGLLSLDYFPWITFLGLLSLDYFPLYFFNMFAAEPPGKRIFSLIIK